MTKRKNAQAEIIAPASGSVLFIPLNKLKKSPRNARKMPHSTADIEALAASIAANGILQNPVVEPEMKDDKPTGFYLVTIGEGRRQAQLLRAKRKEISKDEPVRCLVESEANTLEISLAENAIRSAMHPADQFEAFFELHTAHGMNAEDIAARFGVSAAVVKQRLKLATVSPALIEVYRAGEMNLDQLTAFAITDDHARQEAIWHEFGTQYDRDDILAALNCEHVAADDSRAQFVGLDAYREAGGVIIRDLFDGEHEGFLTDTVLLDRLAGEKLNVIAEAVRAEGWKWVEVMPQHDLASVSEMRRVYPDAPEVSDEAQSRIDALEAEYEALDADDESEENLSEASRIEQAIEALRGDDVYRPQDIVRGGAVVSIGHDGEPRIERGYIKPEDDTRPVKAERGSNKAAGSLPDTLVADLTAHRTLALRDALGCAHDLALTAVIRPALLTP